MFGIKRKDAKKSFSMTLRLTEEQAMYIHTRLVAERRSGGDIVRSLIDRGIEESAEASSSFMQSIFAGPERRRKKDKLRQCNTNYDAIEAIEAERRG